MTALTIAELSDLAKRAAADRVRAIRMHPETIAAIKAAMPPSRPAYAWEPPAFGTPIIADTTVPVGEWEVDR